MDDLCKLRDSLRRNYFRERWFALCPSQERIRLESDIFEWVLQIPQRRHELPEDGDMLIKSSNRGNRFMKTLNIFAVAAGIVATPLVAVAQGKSQHPAPPTVMGKSAPVRQDNRPEKIADKAQRTSERTADQTARNADKAADKTERASEKTERREFNAANDQKHLTKGIKLTSSEKKQLKAIEKKYDAQFRSLRKSEEAADRAARKNGTAENDASFSAQLSQLETQERADMRAVLTPQQQSIFDSNVAKQSTHK
jgi:hypothetical protein